MLKIGSMLVNEEQVQLVAYMPAVPQLDIYTSGQITSFTGPDIAEAWTVLSAETAFVLVGASDGQFLVNSDLVELAYINQSMGGTTQYVFRIQGHNYMFDDPGKFDFSALQPAASASASAEPGAGEAVSGDSVQPAPVADWEDAVKKKGG